MSTHGVEVSPNHRDETRQAVRRRGLIAGTAAFVVGIVAVRTAERVDATAGTGPDGNFVLGSNSTNSPNTAGNPTVLQATNATALNNQSLIIFDASPAFQRNVTAMTATAVNGGVGVVAKGGDATNVGSVIYPSGTGVIATGGNGHAIPAGGRDASSGVVATGGNAAAVGNVSGGAAAGIVATGGAGAGSRSGAAGISATGGSDGGSGTGGVGVVGIGGGSGTGAAGVIGVMADSTNPGATQNAGVYGRGASAATANGVIGAVDGTGVGVRGRSPGGTGGFFTVVPGAGTIPPINTAVYAEGGMVAVSASNPSVVGSTAVQAAGDAFGVSATAAHAQTGVGVAGSGATGVQGTSAGGYGVSGSTGGTGVVAGVYGTSATAYGIIGSTTASGYSGLTAITGTTGVAALAATATVNTAYAAYFQGTTIVQGNFAVVAGSKSAAVPHPDGSHRLIYCIESPEAWFEDFGTGQLVNGKADVRLDPDFAAIVQTDDYHVFPVSHDAANKGLAVVAHGKDGFTVQEQHGGASSGPFSWRVVARRKDNPGKRLEKFVLPKINHPDPAHLPILQPPIKP